MPLQLVLEVDGIAYENAREMQNAVLDFLRTVADTRRIVAPGRYTGFYELPILHAELHVTESTRKLAQPFNPDDNTTGE